jgi:hypothetical protein
MAVRLSALRVGRPLLPGRFQVLISDRDLVDPRAIVRLEELGKFKNAVTSLGFEPPTFRLVTQWLKKLRYRVPPSIYVFKVYFERDHVKEYIKIILKEI